MRCAGILQAVLGASGPRKFGLSWKWIRCPASADPSDSSAASTPRLSSIIEVCLSERLLQHLSLSPRSNDLKNQQRG
jgi:hypothetical protein